MTLETPPKTKSGITVILPKGYAMWGSKAEKIKGNAILMAKYSTLLYVHTNEQ